jgi:pimeloyl-ACP methyl ester carboxylesterase
MKACRLTVTLLILLIAVPSLASAQAAIDGHWEGRMVRAGAELTVSFDFKNQPSGLTGLFNSSTRRAVGIPLRNVTYMDRNVHFLLVGDVTATIFDGEVSGDKINGQFREGSGRGAQFREGADRGGVFHEGDANGTFALQRVQAKPTAFTEEEVTFKNNDVSLSGTLLLPMTNGPHTAIVFLHGSGPEGQATRFFAEYFAGHGIAALISDKRGVGKSTGDWQRSDFNDLADDAVAGIKFLQQRQDINPRKIGIYGHSQGGMIAPLVAARSQDVAFVISGAGHAVPLYEGEVNSITNQVRARGVTGSDLQEATQFIKLWVNVARTGQSWPTFEAAIAKARDKPWFSAMRVPPKDDWSWAFFKRIYDYNAADYWQKVTVPVLVMYGQNDLYTPVAQSITNIDHALGKAGNKDFSIIMFPRATHTFDVDPELDQPFEWSRMAPGFPDVVLAWLHERLK